MSMSTKRQTGSADSGITKTRGGAHGALHGQPMQQPLGKFGHVGQTGHVGRILFATFFDGEFFRTFSVLAILAQRPQHFLQFFSPSRAGGAFDAQGQAERTETRLTASTLAGPLRIKTIPRHARTAIDGNRHNISS